MKYSQLIKRPLPPAPESNSGRLISKTAQGCYHSYTYKEMIITAVAEHDKEEDMLILTFFYGKDFMARSFIAEKEFITQNHDSKKSEAMIDSIDFRKLAKRGYSQRRIIMAEKSAHVCGEWIAERGEASIKLYFSEGVYPPQIVRVLEHQRDIRACAVQERHDKIRRRIDYAMREVRPAPLDKLAAFANKAAFHSNIPLIFGRVENGKAEGVCTRCLHTVIIREPKHMDRCVCPHCKVDNELIAYHIYKRSRGKQQCGGINYAQATSGGILFRTFETKKLFITPLDEKKPYP